MSDVIEIAAPLERDYVERLDPKGTSTPFALMRFRLTYQGTLPPSSRENRCAKEKWQIRRQLNSQLADLYKQEHVLSGQPLFTVWTPKAVPKGEGVTDPVKVPGSSYEFIPLIRSAMDMVCDLDITFLRPGEQGSVVSKDGDLDNRLKTLFDGLKMPTASDMQHGGEVEQPFYCLMNDDALITSLTVRTDRLLAPPTAPEFYALLVIDVTMRILKVTPSNYRFVGMW